MHYTFHTTSRGFSLVETLVAISILLVAIMGPMTIAARGLQAAFYAREEVIAFSLAQEGVELVRSIRDNNALGGHEWLEHMSPSGISPGVCKNSNQGCGVDVRTTAIRNCNSSSCQLYYDSGALSGNRGFYTYVTGGNTTLSQFTRQFWVDPVPPGNDREADVTVIVSWQSGLFGSVRTVTLQSRILNHYNNL